MASHLISAPDDVLVQRGLVKFCLPVAILLMSGCAHQTANRVAPPVRRGVALMQGTRETISHAREKAGTDWDAVVAALGGSKKKAGEYAGSAAAFARKYGSALWSPRGCAVDLSKGQVITSPPGVCSRTGFSWPSNGKVSRGFMVGSNHKGIDITAPEGTPIYAARKGHVIYADNKLSGYGNAVIIQHEGGMTTFYAHMSKMLVQGGQDVDCGQVIGEVGQTGDATGPHLHFEIRRDGTPFDPRPLLP